ncbi:ABC transporter ATP-binding protein [Candidatus Bipolaricaulota bacterium]|nr:ABC transporter ATP-binding protein [Candidatus Bipolaricaulota bacterium]
MMSMKDVTKEYKLGKTVVRALRGLDLEIFKGEVVAIMGPSGSGKSTLMHILGALDIPTAGTAMIDGSDLKDMKERQLVTFRGKKVGFVFQTFNLVQTLSALQNVELPMIFQGIAKSERIRKAKDLLTRVGLAERIRHKPNELSGGERQRVSVARSLANDPEIILADEPTGNLDTETGQSILDLLKELSTKDGRTVIIVTHDPEAAAIADRIIQLRDGCVAAVGRHVTEGSKNDPSAVGSASGGAQPDQVPVAKAEESKASSAGKNSEGRHVTEGSKNDPSAVGSASDAKQREQSSAARAEEDETSSASKTSEGGVAHA